MLVHKFNIICNVINIINKNRSCNNSMGWQFLTIVEGGCNCSSRICGKGVPGTSLNVEKSLSSISSRDVQIIGWFPNCESGDVVLRLSVVLWLITSVTRLDWIVSNGDTKEGDKFNGISFSIENLSFFLSEEVKLSWNIFCFRFSWTLLRILRDFSGDKKNFS